ncbi:MAG TPA: hypothetical protein VGD91_14755 [Trebonia sp.]
MTWPRREPADLIAQMGRHWGWLLGYGVLTVLAGIIVLSFPGLTFPATIRHLQSRLP